jgi:predicted transcriptional regulator
MATTVRISARAHDLLKRQAQETGQTMQVVLEEALELLRRKRFIDGVNADFTRVREDERAWSEMLDERSAWESTVADGLDDD